MNDNEIKSIVKDIFIMIKKVKHREGKEKEIEIVESFHNGYQTACDDVLIMLINKLTFKEKKNLITKAFRKNGNHTSLFRLIDYINESDKRYSK